MHNSARLAVIALAALSAAPLAAQAQGRAAAPPRTSAAPVVYVLAPAGNEARYRVREQLANLDFPNDAVGKTSKVEGRLMIGRDGRIVSDSSRFVVDLASIASDQARRDNYVRRRALQTDSFPTATFVPRSVSGLPAAALARTPGEYTFDLVGDLTVHGVTKPSTWKVKAQLPADRNRRSMPKGTWCPATMMCRSRTSAPGRSRTVTTCRRHSPTSSAPRLPSS